MDGGSKPRVTGEAVRHAGATMWAQAPPDLASWSSAILELGLAGVILAAFLAFLFATLKPDPYLVAGTRHKEQQAHYQERLAASESIVRELRAENREQHLALERIAEDYKDGMADYKQVMRDMISARMRDAFEERGER